MFDAPENAITTVSGYIKKSPECFFKKSTLAQPHHEMPRPSAKMPGPAFAHFHHRFDHFLYRHAVEVGEISTGLGVPSRQHHTAKSLVLRSTLSPNTSATTNVTFYSGMKNKATTLRKVLLCSHASHEYKNHFHNSDSNPRYDVRKFGELGWKPFPTKVCGGEEGAQKLRSLAELVGFYRVSNH
jgi:hypothetical protein